MGIVKVNPAVRTSSVCRSAIANFLHPKPGVYTRQTRILPLWGILTLSTLIALTLIGAFYITASIKAITISTITFAPVTSSLLNVNGSVKPVLTPQKVPRRFGGLGCDTSRCSDSATYFVGGVGSQPMPHIYVVIPFRNRLVSLARLVSSLNSATSPEMRACMCLVVADYDSSVSTLPSWQNPSCVATFNARYQLYMQEDDVDVYARRLKV